MITAKVEGLLGLVALAMGCGAAGGSDGGATEPASSSSSSSGGGSSTASSTGTDDGTTTEATSTTVDDSSTSSSETTAASCDPSHGDSGGAQESGDESTTEPACEPTWSGCGGDDPITIALAAGVRPIALLSAPADGATLAWGADETETLGMLRFSAAGATSWSAEASLRLVGIGGASDGRTVAFGVDAMFAATLQAFADDGTAQWSRGADDADELEDAECPIIAHDPTLGWVVGCAVSGEFGGDGLFRLHTYDDAGALLTTAVTDAAFLVAMQVAGDGRVIVAARPSETEPGALSAYDVASGALSWSIEGTGDEAPVFAVGANVTATLQAGALVGIDEAGEVAWTTPLASDAECDLVGTNAQVARAGDGFVVAGLDLVRDLAVVHHVGDDGTPLCSDGVPTPSHLGLGGDPLRVAAAGPGAWIGAPDVAGRCADPSFWAFRSRAP